MKLVETASSDLFSTGYESWSEKIEFAYDFVSKALENTLGSRLVERVEVADGIFRNTYDNGTSITLNYNENPARAGDLEIEPLLRCRGEQMRMKIRTREALQGLAFISPWLIGFLVFTLVPLVRTFWLSLNEVRLRQAGSALFVDFKITRTPS